jgi:malate dehydrogenase
MAKIGIIGSGNVGANTAFFLAERAVADVMLFDVQEGLSAGKTLDMMEAAPIRGYQTKLSGTDRLEDILDADILIITAGSVRKPGMQREDLFSANRPILSDLASSLSGYAGIVIIVTEPVDLLTTAFAKESGLPPDRILGLGGFLDSTRLRYLISKELSISTESVSAMVIGRHSDQMIPLADYCHVSGVPVAALLDDEQLRGIFEETKNSGRLIVDMAERASAYYGPSAVASDLAESIVRDTRRIISISQMWTGQYGIDGVAMSLPAIIGRKGIVEVMEPILTDEQKAILKDSANTITSIVGQ